MPNDDPRDLFGPIPPKPARTQGRASRSSPPPPSPPPKSYVIYLMDWRPLAWLAISTIVLIVGIVFGTQIDLFFKSNASNQLYVTATAGAVLCCAVWAITKGIRAFRNQPGHEPRPRRTARYRSPRRAAFARSWRLLLALVLAIMFGATTVFAWPHARSIYDKISNYVRQNPPLRDKPRVIKPKAPEKSFLDDPFGWLERNTKQPPEE